MVRKLSDVSAVSLGTFLLLGLFCHSAFAVPRTASVDGDWNNMATWGGLSVPIAGDVVTINNGIDVTVTADAACASIAFVGGSAVNSGSISVTAPSTLAIAGDITLPSRAAGNNVYTFTGTGSISCANLILGTVVVPTADRNTNLTSTIAVFNVAGNVTFRACDNGASQTRPTLYLNAGALDVDGQIVTVNDNDANCLSTLTTTTAPQTGTLILGFTGNPFNLSGQGTNTIQLNGTGATVEYNGAAQTVYGSATTTAYENLVLSNSGVKTLIANIATIGGSLTLSGTASTTTTAALAITNDLVIGDGTSFTAAGFNLTVSGNTTVGGGTSGTFAISNNAGNKTFTGNVTVDAGATWDNDNVVEAVAVNGSFSIDNAGIFNPGTGVYTFNGAAKTIGQSGGTLTIPSITIGAAGTYTATSAITSGTALITTAGGSLDMATYALSVNGITNGGTIYTQNTSGTPLTTGKTWTGTVNYNAATGGQTVMPGTYTTLTMGNTSGTQTAGGALATTTTNTTAGGTLDMVTYALTVSGAPGNAGTIKTQNTTATPIPVGKTWGGTIEYNGAAQTIVSATSYNNLIISTSGAKTLGAATTTINGDFTVTNGGTGTFANLTGRALVVGGDASLSGQSYATYLNLNPGAAWTITVTGTLTATNAYIDYSNASGGTMGIATNSRDNGNNNNWNIQAVWDNGNGNNDWNTAANWVNDWLPGASSDATFNNTSTANCNLNTTKTIQSVTFTGDYTGIFDFTGATLRLTKNADFSTGGALGVAGGSSLEFTGTTAQTLIPSLSPILPQIIQNGAGGTTVSTRGLNAGILNIQAGTLNLGSGLTHSVGSIATSGGTLNFGSSTLQVTGNANLNGAAITAGTGTLQFTGTGTQTFTPKATPTYNPRILHTGSGTLDIAANFYCRNFIQSAGMLDFNAFDVTTSGNFIIDNGTNSTIVSAGLIGTIIAFDGYVSLNGTSATLLNLNATNTWNITRSSGTGTITASYCNIAYCVAGSPPGGTASQSTDGNNNTNWTFDTEDYITWSYSKRIYINTTSSGANISGSLTNFPMLVRLNTNNFSFAQSDGNAGNDVRFAKADGTHLDYEIDSWTDGTSADLWVRLDTIYGNNNTQYFNIYWGKTAAPAKTNSDNVFRVTDGFAVVHHLNTTLVDATPNNNNATNVGTTDNAAGIIGHCRSFNGAQNLTIPNNTSFHATTAISMSAWIYGTGAWGTGVVTNAILRKGQAMPYDYSVAIDESTPMISLEDDDDGGYHSTTQLALSQWYHLAVTWDGGNQYIYLDGVQNGYPQAWSGTIACDARALDIGGPGGANDYWTGSIDEARVSLVARSADWIKLSYESQKPGAGVLIWPKTWDGGGGDNNWSTAANWSEDAVPGASSDVVFNGTSTANCVLDATTAIQSITFTGAYTGDFSFGTSTRTLSVTGTVDFSTGGSITAGDGTLQFTGTSAQVFKPKSGQTFPAITQNGTGGTTISTNGLTAGALTITSGTLNLGAGLTHSVSSIGGTGGGIDFSSSTLRASANVNLASIALTAGTGTLEFMGSTNQTFTPAAGIPNATHTTANRLTLSAANLSCISYNQTAGSLDFNGRNITTTGNFTIANGRDTSIANLDGRTITVGGNASFSGQSGSLLNLDPSVTVWIATVTGNLTANYASINRSTAINANGSASITCANGGVSVTGWTFDTEDYDGGAWASSKRVYFDTSPSGADVTANVTDFPMLVRLDPNDFSGADPQGDDIRFESSTGAPLSYEIERWSGSNAEIWVLVPTVYGNNKSQYIKMWWGNGSAPAKSNPAAVFGSASNYITAYHFNGDATDATSNNYDLTVTGANSYTTGNISSGYSQDGAAGNYARRTAASANLNNVTVNTVSAWVSKINIATNTRSMVDLYNSGTDRAYLYYNTTNRIYVYNDVNDFSLDHAVTGWTPANNTMFHVAWVMDNSNWLVYVNGELKAGSPQAFDMDDINNNVQLGIGCLVSGTANNWDGVLDEVRIADVANSADYIKLCYESQKSGSTCVFFSNAPVVTGPSDSGLVAGYQKDKDSVIVRYEVEDPDGGNVTISAQYKVSGGSWNAMTSANGTGSVAATDGSVTRQVGWRSRSQIGSVENNYYVRIIADDGTYRDTTESALFPLDTRGPTGIGTLAAPTSTGTSVTLTWSAVSDTNFSHYEIWYGTTQNDVRDSTGTAMEYDADNDANLSNKATTMTTISGLATSTTYFFKIWAIDTWSNGDTAANISKATLTVVAPVWTNTGVGTVQGGAITESEIYIGTGANGYALQKIDLLNGTTKWSYSTVPDACRMPTYNYDGGYYKIVASAGNNLVGVQDDGGTGNTQLFPKRGITGPGTPYISTENSYFYVPCTNALDKRNISDGQSVATWPKALANISTAADIVIYNDDVYVATTGGIVYKYNFNGVPYGVSFNTGAAINLPLLVSGVNLFITPNSAKLFKINTSTMDTVGGTGWEIALPAANTGPAFVDGNSIYTACGNVVRKITDNGATASVAWTSASLGATITSGPIPYSNVVYVGPGSGQFHALKDADGTNVSSPKWPYTSASGNVSSGPWIDHSRTRILYGTTTGSGEVSSFNKE